MLGSVLTLTALGVYKLITKPIQKQNIPVPAALGAVLLGLASRQEGTCPMLAPAALDGLDDDWVGAPLLDEHLEFGGRAFRESSLWVADFADVGHVGLAPTAAAKELQRQLTGALGAPFEDDRH